MNSGVGIISCVFLVMAKKILLLCFLLINMRLTKTKKDQLFPVSLLFCYLLMYSYSYAFVGLFGKPASISLYAAVFKNLA